MYVTRCATLALLRPPVACLCADGNFCAVAAPNELAPSLIGWLRCWQQLLPWPQVVYPSSACAYRWTGRRLEELQGGTGRAGKSGSSSRPSGHAVFVHAYRPRSPSSSSSMHHERMAHILSPEVLPHPKSLFDESDVLSPLWGVFPLTAARGLPQELHTLLGLCLRVAEAKSGMLREPCGALWSVVLLGPQLGQHGRPWSQKTSTSPTYHSVFQRSAPEQPLAVQVAFSFCGLRMMLRGSV